MNQRQMGFGFKMQFIRSWKTLFTILLFSIALISCDSSEQVSIQQIDEIEWLSDAELQQLQKSLPQSNTADNIYYFGFDLRASPQEDAAQYLPFLQYLEKNTGYKFKLYFTAKGGSTADELGKNRIQFAAMGATSFLYAQQKYGAISLVRGLNNKGKAEYQSVLVVAPNSDIHGIEDIKGRKLAFGSQDSTQGHLIPRIMLSKNNIKLTDLAGYDYTGSHQKCAESVISGKFDVCGMQDQLAERYESQGLLKIIYRSQYYPSSGIVVNKFVQPKVVEHVKQALVAFDPKGKDGEKLYHWERTEMPRGFISTKEGDYDDLRFWAIQFGFLKQNQPKTTQQ